MGIASVGHRLTILKSVYETKVKQDIPLDADHYIPLCMSTPVWEVMLDGSQFRLANLHLS